MAESVIPAGLTIKEIPLTFDTGITVNGSFKCYQYGKVVLISANNVTFANIGLNQNLVTGVPRPVDQINSMRMAGSTGAETDQIRNNSAYISKDSSRIQFNIVSNNTTRHWFDFVYLVS